MVQVNVISAEELVFANVAKIGSICETSKFSIHFFLLRLIHHKARRVTILTFLAIIIYVMVTAIIAAGYLFIKYTDWKDKHAISE